MVREAEATGQVSLLSPKQAPEAPATMQTVSVSLSRTSISGGPASKQAAAKPTPPPVPETKALEITAKDFDPSDPEKKPAGWSDIKLKKIYIKEWQDRKDGVDEDEIMRRRVHREKEVLYMYTYISLLLYVLMYVCLFVVVMSKRWRRRWSKLSRCMGASR